MSTRIVAGVYSLVAATSFFLISASGAVADSEVFVEFSGRIGVESQLFWQRGSSNQRRQSHGVILEPEIYVENESGSSFSVKPFYRSDSADTHRQHGDLREAYFLTYGETDSGEWEIRLGIDQIFWGVAESTNIVNIINQSDIVEDPFDKVKLGQPMAHLTLSADWGITEFFLLPYHRKRTFPGVNGRFRGPLVVDRSNVQYEHKDKKRHLDFAARYSHSIGSVDFGVTGFTGTSRAPSLIPNDCSETPQPTALNQYYSQIRQIGLDMQVTLESALLKFEGVRRKGARNFNVNLCNAVEEDYSAYIVGGEYSFYSVFGSDSDIIALGEWIYDSRGKRSTETLNQDIFLGLRWALNDTQDTEFVFGYVEDLRYDSAFLTAEFKRRISDSMSLEAEIFSVEKADENDINFSAIKKDSNLRIRLNYNF